MFHNNLAEIEEASSNGLTEQRMCQNGELRIFGRAIQQTNADSANRLLHASVSLWSNWR